MPVYRKRSMTYAVAGYAGAIVATAWAPHLPAPGALLLGACFAAVLSCWRGSITALACAAGSILATGAAGTALEHRVARCVDGTVQELRGTIDGLPKRVEQQTSFDVRPHVVDGWPSCAGPLPRRLRLTWFTAPPIAPGEQWQLRAKIRSVRGYQNPGGFDYEGWSLANAIDGSGSVQFGRRIEPRSGWSWDSARLALRDRVSGLGLAQPGIVLALLTGDAGLMSERDWALFRATGTVHLMVISGLHLTIVAGLGMAIGRALARLRPRLLASSGATAAGLCTAALLATFYAGLAGWGVAVVRAWVATIAVMICVSFGRRAALPATFAWVAAIVLTCDPLAPLQAGFWLSFVAVAVLLAFFATRVPRATKWRTLVDAQLVMSALMIPALLATVGTIAWCGPLANLVAVPVVSAVVVPIELLAGVLASTPLPGSDALFRVADAIIGWTVRYLHLLDGLGALSWRSDSRAVSLAIAALAGAGLLVPLRWRHRAILVPCVALPLLAAEGGPAEGEFTVSVFDVGQGLAAAVQTHAHRLLYDAGPRFASGFDLGRAVVVPALRATAPRDRLDAVVLSHSDIDHVGGYGAVADAFAVRALIGGERVAGAAHLRLCAAGSGWQWDGVKMRVLRARVAHTDNDHSCVLAIDNGRRRVLLPGDLTQVAESELRDELPPGPLDLLIAAHHGSRSSSSAPFVARARPRLVVFSAGHLNRFGHPHGEVVCRFENVGARLLSTANSGAIVWRSDATADVVQWRARSSPFWRIPIATDGWAPCAKGARDHAQSAEAVHHDPQLIHQIRLFVGRQETADLHSFAARLHGDAGFVPAMLGGFDQKAGEEP